MSSFNNFFHKIEVSATVSLLSFLVIFVSATVSQIEYYGVSSTLQGTNSQIELVITFEEPVDMFTFEVLGNVESLDTSGNDQPVDCQVEVRGISKITCELELTEESKTIQINYETEDFIKQLGSNRFLFESDFSLGQDLDRMVTSVKLPEATALVTEGGVPIRLSFPDNATTSSDGRTISVTWTLMDISQDERMKFEIFYESLTTPFWAQLRIRYFLAFGVGLGLVLGFIILRRSRKSGEIVLSVLDEFERKIVDIMKLHDGEIIQRKLVAESNLSKAKVSRVVKDLSDRGIIEIERRGRTNKLNLVKKKFKKLI